RDLSVTTNDKGIFILPRLLGLVTFRVLKIGYGFKSHTLIVSADQAIDIKLVKVPVIELGQ
ncbi:MAG: hypothetical protein ACREMQ_00585, partial [Longimicrobiales bacterium]